MPIPMLVRSIGDPQTPLQSDVEAMALLALELGQSLYERSLECALASALSVVGHYQTPGGWRLVAVGSGWRRLDAGGGSCERLAAVGRGWRRLGMGLVFETVGGSSV